jgi:hypothetical protein
MKKITSFIPMIIIAGGAVAHPGHGHGNPLSPGHYVSSPEHALPLTLAIAAGVVLITWLTHRFQKKFTKK